MRRKEVLYYIYLLEEPMRLRLFLLLLMCVMAPVSVRAQQAAPVTEYYRWDMYEEWALFDLDKMAALRSEGMMQAFDYMADDPTVWWIFTVPPGTAVWGILVTMDTQIYQSDQVMFTTDYQKQKFFGPAVALAEYEHLQQEDGGVQVVVFGHFPKEPKGELLFWEVEGPHGPIVRFPKIERKR